MRRTKCGADNREGRRFCAPMRMTSADSPYTIGLGCRLPADCLYEVRRRKTRRHIEGIRHAIDASSNVDQVAFSIEAQFVILAEIDEHPSVARDRRPRLSPQQYAYLCCEQM